MRASDDATPPTQIALTAKRLKLEGVGAGIVFWTGVIIWLGGEPAGVPATPGAVLTMAGFAWWVSVRVRRWWRHG